MIYSRLNIHKTLSPKERNKIAETANKRSIKIEITYNKNTELFIAVNYTFQYKNKKNILDKYNQRRKDNHTNLAELPIMQTLVSWPYVL